MIRESDSRFILQSSLNGSYHILACYPDSMTTLNDRLGQFFGGYFHQDWDMNGAVTWSEVVDEYLAQVPRDYALAVRDDLRSWLSEAIPGQQLPTKFGCDYDPGPDGMDDYEWVKAIADYLDAKASG